MEAVGTYLYTLRKKHDYTLKQVSDAIGVTDRMVSAWEKGAHQPSLEPIIKLVEFLQAAWEDIAALMIEEKTIQEAKALAHYRFDHPVLTLEQRVFLSGLSTDQRAALLYFVQQMRGIQQ